MANLLETLSRRPVMSDGGMGTQLMGAGLASGMCGELWNVEKPDVIEAVHRRYAEAGAELITTNTFGGTADSLRRHGLADRVAELNRAGAAAARRAAGDQRWVMGDIGPFGGFLEPVGETTPDELRAMFLEQASALREGGADVALVETMSAPEELRIGVEMAKQADDWPVIATFAFNPPGEDGKFRTMMGADVETAMNAALDAGADVVGANCGTSLDLDDYVKLAEQLTAAAEGAPVILQPNAGQPESVDGDLVYPARPDAMADLARRLLDVGVRIVGGCCGTTPDHILAVSKVVKG